MAPGQAATLYRIGKVAKWCGMRPSDLLEMPRTPSSSSLRFSVDEAVVDFMLWFEGKSNERTIGKAPERQPKRGETWVPRYPTVQAILAEYGRDAAADQPPVDMTEVAALVATLTEQAEPQF